MVQDTEKEGGGSEEKAVHKTTLLTYAVELVAAYVAHNPVSPDRFVAMIGEVFHALRTHAQVDQPVLPAEGGAVPILSPQLAVVAGAAPMAGPRPAVDVEKSVTHDSITCLECGEQLTMLKRHLKAQHNMTPEEYKQKWSLGRSYPLVAPKYSQQRSSTAKRLGLGTKRTAKSPKPQSRKPRSPRTKAEG